jgi:hypothetical protein
MAARTLQRLAEHLGEYEIESSTFGCEFLYHKYGILATGPTELRMAFKYHDLKPRVYYARGLDVYPSSRYAQPILNIIVDALPVTNRYERFLANAIQLCVSETLFIYDYASFTSRLYEIRNFMSRLAEFFSDVEIELVDSHFGIIRVNLGDLFERYNDTCNRNPSFDASQVFEATFEEEILQHNCGMLGVPGNISSCTLLHGLFLIALVLSLKWKVVGDDAIAGGPIQSREDVYEYLRYIGIIAPEKMEWWGPEVMFDTYDCEAESWHYTKRPITRIETRVSLKDHIIVWPTISAIIPFCADRFHTVFLPDDEYGIAKKAANALKSFVLQFQGIVLEEEDIDFIDRWIEMISRECYLTKIDEDSGTWRRRTDLLFPVSVREGMDLSQWIDRIWNTRVTLPMTTKGRTKVQEEDFILHSEIQASYVPALKLIRDFGHGSVDIVMRSFLVGDDPDHVQRFLMKSLDPVVYCYVLYESIPSWLFELAKSEACTIHNSLDILYDVDLAYDTEEEDLY